MDKSPKQGQLHPITIAIREIADIFGKMGFSLAYGPELETEWYNFDALNIPGDHPARDMWDTFWTKTKEDEERKLLRTHTSPVQIRWLEKVGAPTRVIAPGKVFRNESTDATHEAQFYQLEGLAIGEGITLAHLKGTLDRFFKEYLGEGAKIRLRPSYFPFTEPSVEVDVWFPAQDKWLEVMGAGMVHPKVLTNAGIDHKKYQGFAFGTGVERLAMIKYGIHDVRLFHSGDVRFVHAFK
jgi:phenylalanyl-tRNA synthetase alpha chain